MTIRRRTVLAGTAALALPVHAQTAPKTAISVRVDRDFEVLDPAFRTGLQDGNIVRAVMQRLITVAPGSGTLTLDAAASVEQVSPTVVEFRLKPGQMFSDGFGEVTADDVKFPYERFVQGLDGRDSSHKGEWANLQSVEVTDRLSGHIVLDRPRAGLFAIALGNVAGSILSRRATRARRNSVCAPATWCPATTCR